MDQLNAKQTWPPVPGLRKRTVTDKIEFIFHKEKPKDRRATYARAVCNIIPPKTETHRKRITEGGNLIYYTGDVSTPTSDLTTMKIHVNSAISDIKPRYMCIYVKCFYLNNHMYGA